LPLELALVDCSIDTVTKEEKPAPVTAEERPRAREETPRPVVKPQTEKPAEIKPEEKPEETAPAPAQAAYAEEPVPDTPEPEPEPAEIEAATEPEPIAASAQPLGSTDAAEQLRMNWKQVIDLAPQETKRSSARAILRSAGITPLSVENGTVVLAFKYNNHKELIEKAENQKVAEKIISNFLGYPCQVKCVLEDNHLLKEALKIGKHIKTEEK
jgi:DNA polymerase-3 subunit gamma/tau